MPTRDEFVAADPDVIAAQEAFEQSKIAAEETAKKFEEARKAFCVARDRQERAITALHRQKDLLSQARDTAAIRWVESLPVVVVEIIPLNCRKSLTVAVHRDQDGGLWEVKLEWTMPGNRRKPKFIGSRESLSGGRVTIGEHERARFVRIVTPST